ncbi:hypothetical protein CORTU0001_0575 [Corynebacterium tuberculostearicum SK141]|uniref:Uncharacterized protein n=1 Tax=Corynebacterium tuberculostearicum SK141 TaxID=553206 RepID=C6R9L0_9CORY|nr:hypothetical protein CORTU0001_0575 [Corynebacterium tuberculostearicum SK141]
MQTPPLPARTPYALRKLLRARPGLATLWGMKKSFLIPFFSLALFTTGCGGSDDTATTISTVKETVTETASETSTTETSTEESTTEETTTETPQEREPRTETPEPATNNQQQANTAGYQCADGTWVEFAGLCKESNNQPPVQPAPQQQAPQQGQANNGGPSADCPAYLCGYGNDANGNRNKSSGEIQTQHGCEQGYITDPQVCGAVGR